MRTILHCDLNSFYASVEIFLNPSLKNKPIAVCGDKEMRHGIVLAKSDPAKAFGVKTGEAIWEAQKKCPDLLIVPPHHDKYHEFSQRVRKIYEDYTDLIEPFGIDECWLDVTGSKRLFGDGQTIAEILRERVKKEIGITISVGVSFNKVFAKLGSDMKKPDAITVIPFDKFPEIIFNLPATDMLGVGKNTGKILERYCIKTIGDVAASDKDFLISKLGKTGECIWINANGLDTSPVHSLNYQAPIKSIGRGTTCPADLMTNEEVHNVIFSLSQRVSHQLRAHSLSATAIQVSVKDNTLNVKQFQSPLAAATQSFWDICEKADEIFTTEYCWKNPVRAITVRAINLIESDRPEQLDFFQNYSVNKKRNNAETAIEAIRNKYGKKAVDVATLTTK